MVLSWCFGFPYAPNEPIRAAAWAVVSNFYDHHFPTVPKFVHSATPLGERFQRAKTRNELVTMADSFDVVVLVDADTLIHPDSITETVDRVMGEPRALGKPFLNAISLPLHEVARIAGSGAWPSGGTADEGAAWVVRPDTWWAAGGMDEGFQSWGAEDTALEHLHTALGGTIIHGENPAVKTRHPAKRWRRDPLWPQTWERYCVSRHIATHPDLAQGWLDERHLPSVAGEWIRRLNINTSRR